jgi:hypothetical protein
MSGSILLIEERVIGLLNVRLSPVICYGRKKKLDDNQCVVFSKMSDVPFNTHNVAIFAPRKAHILVSCYYDSYSGVKNLVKTVRQILDRDVSNVTLCLHEDDNEVDTGIDGLFRVDSKFWVWYEE